MLLPFLQAPFLAGAALSWSLAAPPGPANALMAHDAAHRGFRAASFTGLGAVSADFVMFLLMWWGVLRFVNAFAWTQLVLAVAGAALMTKFAVDAWRVTRAPANAPAGRGSFHRSFLTILTSPFNWAWWLTAGTSLFAQLGLAVMAGFFVGLVGWVAFWSWLATLGASRVRRFREWIGYASVGVLGVFAVVLAFFAVQTARGLII